MNKWVDIKLCSKGLFKVYLIFCVGLTQAAGGPPDTKWTFAVRLIADPGADRDIVQAASDSAQSQVFIDEVLRAEWTAVSKDVGRSASAIPAGIPQRISASGVPEILLLCTPHDLTERHVATVMPADTAYRFLKISFTEEGHERLLALTKNNIGRHLATILDGHIHSIQELDALKNLVWILDNFDYDRYYALWRRLNPRIETLTPYPEGSFLVVWLWPLVRLKVGLLAALMPLLTLMLYNRLRKNRPFSKMALMLFLVSGAVVADILGHQKIYGDAEVRHSISLLNYLLGAVLGVGLAFVGFKIVLHSETKPVKKLRR